MKLKPDPAGAQQSSQVERGDKPATPASRFAQDAMRTMAAGFAGIASSRVSIGPYTYGRNKRK